jgi:hypothetical protein
MEQLNYQSSFQLGLGTTAADPARQRQALVCTWPPRFSARPLFRQLTPRMVRPFSPTLFARWLMMGRSRSTRSFPVPPGITVDMANAHGPKPPSQYFAVNRVAATKERMRRIACFIEPARTRVTGRFCSGSTNPSPGALLPNAASAAPRARPRSLDCGGPSHRPLIKIL